jgi:chromosome segregation ATPase
MSEPDLNGWYAANKLNFNADRVVSDRNFTKKVECEGETCKHDQLERIGQLEQALEQSLTSLNELKQKLKDQHLLETQLAATEEIANLQQQAITQLKQQVTQRHRSQTRLQYTCLELEKERDHALARLTQLKQVTVTLQEQVLQQSQQAGEYEAALQYWKARYLRNLQLALQLKEALEQLQPDSASELSEILRAV